MDTLYVFSSKAEVTFASTSAPTSAFSVTDESKLSRLDLFLDIRFHQSKNSHVYNGQKIEFKLFS